MKKFIIPILAIVCVAMLSSCKKEIELAGTIWVANRTVYSDINMHGDTSFVDSANYSTFKIDMAFKDAKSGKLTIDEVRHSGSDTNVIDPQIYNFTYTFSDNAGIIKCPYSTEAGEEFNSYTFSVRNDGTELIMPMDEELFVFRNYKEVIKGLLLNN